ncbi:hypothetical protein SAMD00019534_045010 [Acytostelium subglobosum LB1]|uniref:hypothetical protein n=1 Tax=Acytostelium subglobosum LB1 TaxID=1410327 RepID=UPI000644FE73|nr:hypothetical protein SAMD00019534_045010 [Acytostelium subglobosum LB1]GAM21326.1 hypothetical protein SAMD00019534_045010 [Acytostelium subglobosum LB1]|eukprot:XP_012755445.1 hypothetical protein SAMD00019534_045010 [Acytostelium subglobosum LB1]
MISSTQKKRDTALRLARKKAKQQKVEDNGAEDNAVANTADTTGDVETQTTTMTTETTTATALKPILKTKKKQLQQQKEKEQQTTPTKNVVFNFERNQTQLFNKLRTVADIKPAVKLAPIIPAAAPAPTTPIATTTTSTTSTTSTTPSTTPAVPKPKQTKKKEAALIQQQQEQKQADQVIEEPAVSVPAPPKEQARKQKPQKQQQEIKDVEPMNEDGDDLKKVEQQQKKNGKKQTTNGAAPAAAVVAETKKSTTAQAANVGETAAVNKAGKKTASKVAAKAAVNGTHKDVSETGDNVAPTAQTTPTPANNKSEKADKKSVAGAPKKDREVISGFNILPVSIPNTPIKKYIYYKKETSKKWPINKTLFVANLPQSCTTLLEVQVLFQSTDIESVHFGAANNAAEQSAAQGVVPTTSDDAKENTGVAHIVMSSPKTLQELMQYLTTLEVQLPVHTTDGYDDMMNEEQSKIISDYDKLQATLDQIMMDYDKRLLIEQNERRQQSTQPDEDGFVLVTGSNKNFKPMTTEEAKALNDSRRHKNFYSFQQRQQKKQELDDLRKKFEEDKQKIAKMSAARKFKPY